MVRKRTLTSAEKEYLEAIYTIQAGANRVATTGDLARCLSIKDASVTEMLKKLREKELVQYTPYYGAVLTETGRKIAATVKRRHRIVARYLVDICGVDPSASHKQACELEHFISDEAIENLAAQLGHPSARPGGAPFQNGQTRSDTGRSLSEIRKRARHSF